VAALALTAVLAGCAAPAPPPPPPPAPVAVIPQVYLSPKLVEQAAAYRAYINRASRISPNFSGGGEVADSLKTAESFEPQHLLRGAIAYGAVVALQDPAFVAGVRKFVADPEQRRTVAYEIMKDNAYVVGISGSSSAAGLVMNVLGEDGRKLLLTGRSVKQAAYDVQHQAWSKGDVPGRVERLALAKQLSSTPGLGDVEETARLQTAVTGPGQMGVAGDAANPPYTPLVIRSLAIAALAALGYADDASMAQLMPILAEPNSASCLNMSKLNLYQCLAVAKPHYEDVFCLGQHILIDTGHCLMKGVGVAEPVDPRAQALADAAAAAAAKPVKKTPPKRSKKR
jgi:hypothetical protein